MGLLDFLLGDDNSSNNSRNHDRSVFDSDRFRNNGRDELAANLQMTPEELDALLTPTRDYTISEIRHLLGGVYLDIRVDIVPE